MGLTAAQKWWCLEMLESTAYSRDQVMYNVKCWIASKITIQSSKWLLSEKLGAYQSTLGI